jgi:tetratricopeptide (TPR) repeat protein
MPGLKIKNPLTAKQVSLASILLIACVTFIIYGHTLTSPFHFDDQGSITTNLMVRSLKSVFEKYDARPVLSFSYAINYFLGKYNTFSYHLFNLLIHILCAILAYLIFELTFRLPNLGDYFNRRAQRLALFGALIFAAHPLRTETVIYLSSRSTLLASLFYLAAFFLFILALYRPRLKILCYTLACLCSILGLGSKEIVATLPVAVLLYDYMLVSGMSLGEVKKRRLFYLFFFGTLLATVYLLLIGHIRGAYGKTSGFGMPFVSPPDYLFTQFTVVLYYLKLIFIPTKFNLDYYWPYAKGLLEYPTFLSFLVLIGIIILILRTYKKKPVYAFLVIWYFLLLAPESSIAPLKDVIFEHRTYLPSLGPILLFVIAIDKAFVYLIRKKPGLNNLMQQLETILFSAILLLLGFLTIKQSNIWLNEITLWEDTVKKSPQKARPHLNLGIAYKNAGFVEKAMAQCRESFRVDPNYSRGQCNLGAMLFEQGKVEEALKELEEAAKKTSSLPELHNNLGIVYRQKGRTFDAIRSFKKAIAMDPQYVNAYQNLGDLYYQSGRIEDAIGTYLKLLSMTPDDPSAHANLGALYSKKGMLIKAVKELQEAIRLNPKDFQSYYNLGFTFEKMGMVKEAIAAYKEATKINPKFAEPHNNLAALYKQLGMLEDAIREHQALVTINPMNGPNMANLLFTKMKKKEMDTALEEFNQAAKANPKDKDAYIKLSKACMQLKLYGRAQSVLEELLKIDPNSYDAYLNMGIIQGANGEHDKAITYFKKAIEINPNDARGYYNLAIADENKSLIPLAIKRYEEAIARDPKHKRAYLNLGVLFARENRIDDAIKAFKEATKIDPNFAEAYLNLGGLYRKKGDLKNAEQQLKKAIELRPDYALAHFNLALIYLEQGRTEEAKQEQNILMNLNKKLADALSKSLP